MAKFACSCETGGIGNLGAPKCKNLFGAIAKIIFVPTYAEDESLNGIPETALVNGKIPKGYFNGKLTDPIGSNRFYITEGFFDATTFAPIDSTTETVDTGVIYELVKGVMQFTGNLRDLPPSYAGQIETAKCGEASVYFMDAQGNLLGTVATDGIFYPLQISEGSLIANWTGDNNGAKGFINVTFQLDRTEQSKDFLTLQSSTVEENLLKSVSLIDIEISEDSANPSTTASVIFDTNYDYYGSALKSSPLLGKVGVTGVIANWWSVQVGGLEVDIASVTGVDGKYTITPVTPFTSLDVVTVKYVENRLELWSKGYESNSLSITI